MHGRMNHPLDETEGCLFYLKLSFFNVLDIMVVFLLALLFDMGIWKALALGSSQWYFFFSCFFGIGALTLRAIVYSNEQGLKYKIFNIGPIGAFMGSAMIASTLFITELFWSVLPGVADGNYDALNFFALVAGTLFLIGCSVIGAQNDGHPTSVTVWGVGVPIAFVLIGIFGITTVALTVGVIHFAIVEILPVLMAVGLVLYPFAKFCLAIWRHQQFVKNPRLREGTEPRKKLETVSAVARRLREQKIPVIIIPYWLLQSELSLDEAINGRHLPAKLGSLFCSGSIGWDSIIIDDAEYAIPLGDLKSWEYEILLGWFRT